MGMVLRLRMEKGDELFSSAGSGNSQSKYERNGRNPQTGEPMMLAPGKVVTFKRNTAAK